MKHAVSQLTVLLFAILLCAMIAPVMGQNAATSDSETAATDAPAAVPVTETAVPSAGSGADQYFEIGRAHV